MSEATGLLVPSARTNSGTSTWSAGHAGLVQDLVQEKNTQIVEYQHQVQEMQVLKGAYACSNPLGRICPRSARRSDLKPAWSDLKSNRIEYKHLKCDSYYQDHWEPFDHSYALSSLHEAKHVTY